MNDEQFASLYTYLEDRLGGTETTFGAKVDELDAKLENRLAGLEAKFDTKAEKLDTKLENRLVGIGATFGAEVQKLDTKFEEIDGKLDRLLNTVDGIAKRLDDDGQEQLVTNHRHEGWIVQLAEKTGTHLQPELER